MRPIPCPIEPELLREMYSVRKLTDQKIVDEIAEMGFLDHTVKHVRSWRKKFGIETILPSSRHDLPPLEGRLLSVFLGSMLGDGGLARQTKKMSDGSVYSPPSANFFESHCGAQVEYLKWKVEQWGPEWVRDMRQIPMKDKRIQFRMWTHNHPSLLKWHQTFYPSGKGNKLFCEEIVPLVDPLALAIWYMDDGTAGWWPAISFGGFGDSRKHAIKILENFGLTVTWVPWQSKSPHIGYLTINGIDNANKFLDIIRPHVPPCMAHKLNPGYITGERNRIKEAIGDTDLNATPIRQLAKKLGVSATTLSRRRGRIENAAENPFSNQGKVERAIAQLPPGYVKATDQVRVVKKAAVVGKNKWTFSAAIDTNRGKTHLLAVCLSPDGQDVLRTYRIPANQLSDRDVFHIHESDTSMWAPYKQDDF